MIRIAIVEDEMANLQQFRDYLRRYEAESGHSISVTEFRDGEQILNNYTACYDIILMDIQMRLVDGMTAAERIRRVDQEVVIIFITNMPQYAIRGYAVDALDYVLKPVTYFAFSQRIDRAIDRISRKKKRFLTVATKTGSRKIESTRLKYVESSGHTLTFHTQEGDYSTTGVLKDVEALLEGYGFSRCNKGLLVNLEYVDAISDGCAVLGTEKLPISRGRKAEFMEDLTSYLGGGAI